VPHPATYGRPPAPKPGIIPLRPLGLGEILDGSFTTMRWNPKAILIPSLVLAVISGVLVAVSTYLVERGVMANINFAQSGAQITQAQSGQVTGTALIADALNGVHQLIVFFGSAILTGILTGAIGQAVLGRKETLGSVWRTVKPRLWTVIGTVLLQALFVGGGWILAMGLSVGIGIALGAGAHQVALGVLLGVAGGLTASVFAVFFYIRWAFAVPAVVLENARPIQALKRSWRLVRGSWWRVFGILLLAGLIVGIASGIISFPFQLGEFLGLTKSAGAEVAGALLTGVGTIIAGTVTAPLTAGVSVLLYTDLRMRREGMDIALQSLAAPAAQPPGPAEPAADTRPYADPQPYADPRPPDSPEPGAW
jgi:hypothetical protein